MSNENLSDCYFATCTAVVVDAKAGKQEEVQQFLAGGSALSVTAHPSKIVGYFRWNKEQRRIAYIGGPLHTDMNQDAWENAPDLGDYLGIPVNFDEWLPFLEKLDPVTRPVEQIVLSAIEPRYLYILLNLIYVAPGICQYTIIDGTHCRQSSQRLEDCWEELRLNERRLRSLLDKAPLGIFELNGKGELLWFNEAFYKMKKVPPDELMGFGWKKMVPEEDIAKFFHLWETARDNNEQHFRYEGRMKRKDGEMRWVVLESVDITEPGGPSRILGSAYDHTEVKNAQLSLEASNEELKRALQEAETAKRARSQFFASVSHEIRTPLNGVIGMSSLLKDTELSDDQKHLVDVIIECGQYLLQLVNDVLQMSKIDSEIEHFGKLELHERPFDIQNFLKNILKMFSLAAGKKNLELVLEVCKSDCVATGDNQEKEPLTEPCWILADEGRIRQIIVNLISNAIKFTDKGSVHLRASVCYGKCSEHGKARIHFEVEDTGIGIPPEDIETIFSPFKQIDGSQGTRDGAGLGLYITSKFLEALDSNISVSSKLNEGSKFRFSIEAKRTLPHPENPVQRTPLCDDWDENKNLRLLVVEDNPINLELCLRCLKKLGFIADSCTSGEQALLCQQQEKYDIIFMDIQMPGISGMEATQMMRSDPATYGDPYIVALTANAMDSDRTQCLKAGMNAFLPKPFKLEQLAKVLCMCENDPPRKRNRSQ